MDNDDYATRMSRAIGEALAAVSDITSTRYEATPQGDEQAVGSLVRPDAPGSVMDKFTGQVGSLAGRGSEDNGIAVTQSVGSLAAPDTPIAETFQNQARSLVTSR